MMAPLGVVHADKSIVGFSLVCEANETKSATSLGISIFHNNLPHKVSPEGPSQGSRQHLQPPQRCRIVGNLHEESRQWYAMQGPCKRFSSSIFVEVWRGTRVPDEELCHSYRTSVAGSSALFCEQEKLCYGKDVKGICFGSLEKSIEVVRHRQAALANDRCKIRSGGLPSRYCSTTMEYLD
jgi:hypothetical protein